MRLLTNLFSISLLFFTIPTYSGSERLNEFISHYETLDYNPYHVVTRNRRSDGVETYVYLQFHSYGKLFHLKLKRDLHIFNTNFEVVSYENKPLKVDTSHLYKGSLINEPGSRAYGSIINGVFDGQIHSNHGVYYIEKASKYRRQLRGVNSQAHSIIYKTEDVVDPSKNKRSHGRKCGLTPEIAKRMTLTKRRAAHETHKTNSSLSYDSSLVRSLLYNAQGDSSIFKRTTCSLYIRTDPTFWKYMKDNVNSAVAIRKEITSLIAQHVQAVNDIFMDTNFDGEFPHRMVRFEIQRIKIDDDEACWPNRTKNVFCEKNMVVHDALEYHSTDNHEDYCLAYLFTFRDFLDGVLGLAYTASPNDEVGICSTFSLYGDAIESKNRSYNTGVITFLNEGTSVAPKLSQSTLAHEIGHSFGSFHDIDSECLAPDDDEGNNYLMYPLSSNVDKPNNEKFSKCSITQIAAILDLITEGRRRDCFTEWKGAFCGNKIVDVGEECDCGYDFDDCKENCCYPRIVTDLDLIVNPAARGCQRRIGAQCSPSEGQCCNSSCNFIQSTALQQCKDEEECSEAVNCAGNSSKCPLPPSKEDGTVCNGMTKTCLKGECSVSICVKWSMKPCYLSSKTTKDKQKLCELACQTETNATCRGTSEFLNLSDTSNGVALRAGSPCDNFKGYCDVFRKCRPIDALGLLSRVKNRFFSRKGLNSIHQWIKKYWLAVTFMAFAFIAVMMVIIKCFAAHTNSSNPRRSPALRFIKTVRHPVKTFRLKRKEYYDRHQRVATKI